MTITQQIAAKVLATVDAGLCSGAEPGKMCIEAAVCYALGLPQGDDLASCVSRALRSFTIRLNDAGWSSNDARAKGLRRLALILLGSAGHLNDMEFVRRIATLAIRKSVPAALRSAASIQKDPKHKAAMFYHAIICEREGTRKAAFDAKAAVCAAANSYAAAAAAYAADADAAAYAASAADAAAYAAYAYDPAADAADAYAYAAAYSADASAASYVAAAYAAAYAAGYADDAAAYADDAAAAAYSYADDAAADAAHAAYAYAADAAAGVVAAGVVAASVAAASVAAASVAAASVVAHVADAADAAADATRDKSLADFAEAVVQLLIEMNVPGLQWLELAPLEVVQP